MNAPYLLIPAAGLLLLCSCSVFYGSPASSAPAAQGPRPLAVPVGKNWQIVEEAPKLSDERGRLPFQTEQSLEPDGAKSAAPADSIRIETDR
ncbi:MAG: hypothetical protein IPQ16_07190 [Geobacteraceae bacterium]|nr:hypothetical protein [Geobacteraceae bacterium]